MCCSDPEQTEEIQADLRDNNQHVHCCQTKVCAACCWTALCRAIHPLVHYYVYAPPSPPPPPPPFMPESLPVHILEPCAH